jgi:cell division initiation protein
MLTPADIEQKTFSTALRGYDLDEVDDFLDQVVATIRDLQEELAEARSSAAKTPEPVADESAVGRALIAAQSAADQIMAAAREDVDRALATSQEQADRILDEARGEADGLMAERDSKRAAAEAEMQVLSERVSNIRTQLALLATAVADKLDEMDALVASDTAESGQAAGTEDWDEEGASVISEAAEGAGEEDAEETGAESLFDEEGSDEEEDVEEEDWEEEEEEEDEDEDEDSLP